MADLNRSSSSLHRAPRTGALVCRLAVALTAWLFAAALAADTPRVAPPGAAGSAPARRIVSLAPNLTEMLFAIGAGPQLAGVTDYCDFPPEARALPKVGGFVNPNPETVLSLAPDLVVATPNVGNRPFVERMMRAGARVVVVEARNLEEIFPALETLGRASGHADAATALAARLRRDIEAIRREVAGASRPRAILCIQRDPLIVAGPGSYPHDLLLLAGARSVVTDAPSAYPTISLERVIESAPEVILQTRMDTAEGGSQKELAAWWGRWGSIPAVRSGRVHLIAGDAILRPGPRVTEGLRMLVGLLHPQGGPGDRENRGDKPAAETPTHALPSTEAPPPKAPPPGTPR